MGNWGYFQPCIDKWSYFILLITSLIIHMARLTTGSHFLGKTWGAFHAFSHVQLSHPPLLFIPSGLPCSVDKNRWQLLPRIWGKWSLEAPVFFWNVDNFGCEFGIKTSPASPPCQGRKEKNMSIYEVYELWICFFWQVSFFLGGGRRRGRFCRYISYIDEMNGISSHEICFYDNTPYFIKINKHHRVREICLKLLSGSSWALSRDEKTPWKLFDMSPLNISRAPKRTSQFLISTS